MNKVLILTFIASITLSRKIITMEKAQSFSSLSALDTYDPALPEYGTDDLGSGMVTPAVIAAIEHARMAPISKAAATQLLQTTKPAQWVLLAHWLHAGLNQANQHTMFSVFLRMNKLCGRKQAKNVTFLTEQLETHGPLLYALGDIMSHERFPDNLPVKPLYRFVDNGRQIILRKKLLAHSDIDPEKLDWLVYKVIHELAI